MTDMKHTAESPAAEIERLRNVQRAVLTDNERIAQAVRQRDEEIANLREALADLVNATSDLICEAKTYQGQDGKDGYAVDMDLSTPRAAIAKAKGVLNA